MKESRIRGELHDNLVELCFVELPGPDRRIDLCRGVLAQGGTGDRQQPPFTLGQLAARRTDGLPTRSHAAAEYAGGGPGRPGGTR